MAYSARAENELLSSHRAVSNEQMNTEDSVARNYTHGSLEQAILDALRGQGADLDHLTPAGLAPVDEFHIGGRQATIELAARLGFQRGMRLLDIGCGLGGAARYFADEHGCRVIGIDLTSEFVEVANSLARRVGLAGMVSYQQGSAVDLPFAKDSFDGAYMLHVGMNIEDKARLFTGVRGVLKAGGMFGIYDVMRTGEGELTFPVPWAPDPETSFVSEPAAYRSLLEAAGFEVIEERNLRDFAVDFFRQARARAAQGGPTLGVHLLIKSEFARKMGNVVGNLERGLISPVELICRAV